MPFSYSFADPVKTLGMLTSVVRNFNTIDDLHAVLIFSNPLSSTSIFNTYFILFPGTRIVRG